MGVVKSRGSWCCHVDIHHVSLKFNSPLHLTQTSQATTKQSNSSIVSGGKNTQLYLPHTITSTNHSKCQNEATVEDVVEDVDVAVETAAVVEVQLAVAMPVPSARRKTSLI